MVGREFAEVYAGGGEGVLVRVTPLLDERTRLEETAFNTAEELEYAGGATTPEEYPAALLDILDDTASRLDTAAPPLDVTAIEDQAREPLDGVGATIGNEDEAGSGSQSPYSG